MELYFGNGNIPRKIALHLYRVVSGLESSLIGETAIQSQVKKAYMESLRKECLLKSFHLLFQSALKVGKRVRTETNISGRTFSHSLAALQIIKKNNVDLTKSNVLILRVNNLNRDVISLLVKKSIKAIFIINRSFDKALQ